MSYPESLALAAPPPAEAVKRLVFVCHGNICRSAFADVVARGEGMNVASFGLSTGTGGGAHPPAAEAARRLGYDLSGHVTTNVTDFVPMAGDYLLSMELRHVRKLARHEALRDLPSGLLGNYARPAFPHLHDPYKLDPQYMDVCLARIEGATKRLSLSYPGARL